jgi:cyclopropane fatty-acyl-phospholipid synthase-like methyltransferase
MKLRERIIPWCDRTIEEQRSECESQVLVTYVREARADWVRTYTYLAHDLAVEFGEEEVLDILEESMWNMHYDAGLTWREEFDNNAQKAIDGISERWAGGARNVLVL